MIPIFRSYFSIMTDLLNFPCIVGSSVSSIFATTIGERIVSRNGMRPSIPSSNSWFPSVYTKNFLNFFPHFFEWINFEIHTIASAGSILRKWVVTFHLNRLYQRVPWKLSLNVFCKDNAFGRFDSKVKVVPSIQIQRICVFPFDQQFFDHRYCTSISTDTLFSVWFTRCRSFIRFVKSEQKFEKKFQFTDVNFESRQ